MKSSLCEDGEDDARNLSWFEITAKDRLRDMWQFGSVTKSMKRAKDGSGHQRA